MAGRGRGYADPHHTLALEAAEQGVSLNRLARASRT
ncbi:MAG: toxin-antitoxin system HicB family antitoxin [Rhodanobacteraceae bacterium]|nr:toxin-antitoxin system HicB family antitoxin [Rhodanobacteraceae bacterium]MBK7044774.1 toxin-antitoxin system HicB family antitoxin [Rhodanobacteraceae bacterium]